MLKKLAITHSLDKTVYAILRRRLNGNIYCAANAAEEALGTWNDARKAACAVAMTDQKGGNYTAEFPEGCDDGVWDAFYYERAGATPALSDRLLGREKFINGAASIAEQSMLAAGHTAGKTVYADIRSQDNAYIWDAEGETLEAVGTWTDGRAAECAYLLDDKGGGYYTKAFPIGITAAGMYHIQYKEKLEAEYDIEDRTFGRDKILWFGSTESGEVVPTGSRGKAMVNLRNLIAECESFQAWVGAADAEEAKEYLWLVACYVPETGEFVKPMGLIYRSPNDRNEAIAVDSDTVSGELELRFDDNIPADYKEQPHNAELHFLNKVEAVLTEMWTLSRQPGKIGINHVTLVEGPTQWEEKSGSDRFVNVVRYQISWGIEG